MAGYIAEFRQFLPGCRGGEVNHIPTCNISYKRKIFDKFGLFSGEYYPQEDLVFNFNLRRNGERILLDPSIKVYHHHRSLLKGFLLHQYNIGSATSCVLRVLSLEGSYIARRRWLALLAAPALPVVKFLRTLVIFFKYDRATVLKAPSAVLLFGLGLVFWAAGFVGGAFVKKRFRGSKV